MQEILVLGAGKIFGDVEANVGAAGAGTGDRPRGVDQAGTLLKLLDTLDDNDDVQNIASNFDIPDDVLARLA